MSNLEVPAEDYVDSTDLDTGAEVGTENPDVELEGAR